MGSNLEILYTNNQLIIKKLSYKKIIIEYSVPLYFTENDRKPISEPLEWIKVKMRYQFDRQDKCYKIISSSKSYTISLISNKFKIKLCDILFVSNGKCIFDKIEIDTLVVSLCIVGNDAYTIFRDIQINKILI